jgi:hypothetical protein
MIRVSVSIAWCCFFVKIVSVESHKLERHAIDNFLYGYLRLETEARVNVVASLLLFLENPATVADHDIFAQLGEIGREVSFVGGIIVLVIAGNCWTYWNIQGWERNDRQTPRGGLILSRTCQIEE